jgi:biopolymer transport protein ExbD
VPSGRLLQTLAIPWQDLLPAARAQAVQRKARIEIIPLIDVIFFLLATFVLFTLSLNKSGGLAVTLPQVVTSDPRDPTGATITVTQEGTLAWDKDPITLDEFLIRLQNLKQQMGPDARILINGDENAVFQSGALRVRRGAQSRHPKGTDRNPDETRAISRPKKSATAA